MNVYISPAIASTVRICIDEYNDCVWKGNIYTRLSDQKLSFRNMNEMMSILETFWDIIGFPQESVISRRFAERKVLQSKDQQNVAIKITYPQDGMKDKIKVELSEEDMEKKRGDKGTFIVNIRYRQNATWQGHVTWVEENKTVSFRSALELIKLIDSTQNDNAEDWTKD